MVLHGGEPRSLHGIYIYYIMFVVFLVWIFISSPSDGWSQRFVSFHHCSDVMGQKASKHRDERAAAVWPRRLSDVCREQTFRAYSYDYPIDGRREKLTAFWFSGKWNGNRMRGKKVCRQKRPAGHAKHMYRHWTWIGKKIKNN